MLQEKLDKCTALGASSPAPREMAAGRRTITATEKAVCIRLAGSVCMNRGGASGNDGVFVPIVYPYRSHRSTFTNRCV